MGKKFRLLGRTMTLLQVIKDIQLKIFCFGSFLNCIYFYAYEAKTHEICAYLGYILKATVGTLDGARLKHVGSL